MQKVSVVLLVEVLTVLVTLWAGVDTAPTLLTDRGKERGMEGWDGDLRDGGRIEDGCESRCKGNMEGKYNGEKEWKGTERVGRNAEIEWLKGE